MHGDAQRWARDFCYRKILLKKVKWKSGSRLDEKTKNICYNCLTGDIYEKNTLNISKFCKTP